MKTNVKAATLTAELFDLLVRLNALELEFAHEQGGTDAALEFNGAVCHVAAAYGAIKACDLVTDASRDTADQSY